MFIPLVIEALINLLKNDTSAEKLNLNALMDGHQDFEKVCSLWKTYMYLLDNSKGKFLYISPTFCHALGIDHESMQHDGFEGFSSFIHPDDLAIIQSKIDPFIKIFLAALPPSESQESPYRFTYTYRILKKNNEYMDVGLVSKILSYEKSGAPILELGLLTPLSSSTNQKNKISFTITKTLNEFDYSTLVKEEFHYDYVLPISLTERELEIVGFLKSGMSSRSISEKLHVSLHTIRNHRMNILRKTNTHKISELITLLNKLGIE